MATRSTNGFGMLKLFSLLADCAYVIDFILSRPHYPPREKRNLRFHGGRGFRPADVNGQVLEDILS